MKQTLRGIMTWVVPVTVIALVMFTGFALSQEVNSDLSKVIYYVG